MSRLLGRLAAACLLLAALLGVSCGSVPRTYYYTLRTPPPPAASDPNTNFVLGVDRFRAPEMLRDDRIVYYESPTQMNFYQYHRWGSDPASMLSELAAHWLDGLGVFSQVRMLPLREPVDYILRGRLFNFEEVDYEGGGKARVSLELTLMRSRDRQGVWSMRRQVEVPINETGITGVVNAVNAASFQLLREAIPGLVARVEQDYKASQGPSQ